ncbi:hypothetical protein TNCV_1136081 [Trichonephila clavipes]|nr:hypothetical protein TNCV_1136081 [Trichonephila clavipes]
MPIRARKQARCSNTFVTAGNGGAPSTFRGRLGKTLSNGLKVRSVANFNKWDDMMCLANVYFFLTTVDFSVTVKNIPEGQEEQLNAAQRSGREVHSLHTKCIGTFCQEEKEILDEEDEKFCHT